MNAYDVIRDVHRIGSPMAGTVSHRTDLTILHGFPSGHLTLDTTSEFRAILPFAHLTDDHKSFSPELIPNVGDRLETVVFNFVEDTLYLSARPSDLKRSTIQEWQDFYAYVDTLSPGMEVMGVVERVEPFGLFVNIGSPYIGLIDIGHTAFNRGHALPYDNSEWPQVGDRIRCVLGYVRFHTRQIGLGWLPD